MRYDVPDKPIVMYLGTALGIKMLRDFILDNTLTSDDTILVSTFDFDEIALDHRKIYNESIIVPYFLVGVLIKEDDHKSRLSVGHVIVVKNDFASRRVIQETREQNYYDGEPIYRCGWCGNVVDFDGTELESSERQRSIAVLRKFGREVDVKRVNGSCCPSGIVNK